MDTSGVANNFLLNPSAKPETIHTNQDLHGFIASQVLKVILIPKGGDQDMAQNFYD